MRTTKPGRRWKRWRSDRGQSTALVTSMLMVLMLFVGVVVDVGQAVNRRIAVQIVADTGAYTGAAVMATGLNQMAYWNARLQDAWALFTWAMLPAFTIHDTECDAADGAEGIYSVAWDTLNIAFQGVSYAYANYPYMQARAVSINNIYDLFPGEADRFRFAEWSISPEVGVIPMSRDYMNLMNTEPVPDGTDPSGAIPGIISSQTSLTYACESFPPPKVEIRNRDYNVWYMKSGDAVKHFVWIVTAPSTKALVFDSLFGGNVIPEMRAVAVAKPVGGSIKDGTSDYVTKMEVLSKVMTLPAIIDSKYDRGFRPVTH
jgi:hypothetical protein